MTALTLAAWAVILTPLVALLAYFLICAWQGHRGARRWDAELDELARNTDMRILTRDRFIDQETEPPGGVRRED